MKDPYQFDGLDRYNEFYHVFNDYVVDPSRERDSYTSPWELWVATLARARHGDFSWVPSLLDVYTRSEDPVLKELCADLLSDAASGQTVSVVKDSIARKIQHDGHYDPNYAVDMSRVVFRQMRLADVPLLLRIYQDGDGLDDVVDIDIYMYHILGGETFLVGGKANLEADCELVIGRYEELMSKYGTNNIVLWHGVPFSVVEFVRQALMGSDLIPPLTVRDIFEAETGIDCRGFFKDEEYQALTASAAFEEFLHSPKAERFEPGVRYFFGHRLPT